MSWHISCAIHHVIMHWHAPECKGFHIHTPKASLGQLQRQTEIWYAPSMLLCKYQSHIWHIWDKNGCANEGYIRILSQNTRINLHKNGLKISFMVAWKDVLVNNRANRDGVSAVNGGGSASVASFADGKVTEWKDSIAFINI